MLSEHWAWNTGTVSSEKRNIPLFSSAYPSSTPLIRMPILSPQNEDPHCSYIPYQNLYLHMSRPSVLSLWISICRPKKKKTSCSSFLKHASVLLRLIQVAITYHGAQMESVGFYCIFCTYFRKTHLNGFKHGKMLRVLLLFVAENVIKLAKVFNK